MSNVSLLDEIMKKKEFSGLPKEDVQLAFAHFNKEQYSNREKVKLTRDLLRKVYSAFLSTKVLQLRERDPLWVLKKHVSTKERLPYYDELYSRIFASLPPIKSIFDLGCGVNGFSYAYLQPFVLSGHYYGIEAIQQLVDVTRYYFEQHSFSASIVHQSLFSLKELVTFITHSSKPRLVFLFKVIDSLEMVKQNYSKELLTTLSLHVDFFVISFAMKSLVRRSPFYAKRTWLLSFLREHFVILDDFEMGGERYLLFKKK